MNTFLWKQLKQEVVSGKTGDLHVQCHPLRGLELQAGSLHLPSFLGLEIVDAVNLGPQPLVSPNTVPDMVIRQDTISVRYAPTTKRPVECQARWRVLPEGVFDLEVSTLTPGKWDDLAVQTRTTLNTTKPNEEVHIEPSVTPGIVIYRPAGQQLSYVEFCHPHDGIGLDIKSDATTTTVHYRLFGLDLEKGVILRGRLRGMIVPRSVDVASAHAAYERFIAEAPNLTL
ncbi:MAG TPA: hypothetical protein PLN21_14575 [Gemmatales bacterium]|nr:hypothetical protein [Gemmatales bacterium]